MLLYLKGIQLSVKCRFTIVRKLSKAQVKADLFSFHPAFSIPEEQKELREHFVVLPEFISEDEENSLLREIEPVLKRIRYEVDHWDAAILGYRETEKRNWNSENTAILQRVRNTAFSQGASMPLVHVLDLKADGVIKPHVDSVKFCGNTITGLSLLTAAVMRLTNEKDSSKTADILLPRRSLYVMTGTARYDYSHSILGNDQSVFNGEPIVKDRRVSVICRNDPSDS